MNLLPNWKAVMRYAWSYRLNIIAALLSGLEAWFTFIDPYSLPIPNGTFAVLAVLVNILASGARLVVQTKLSPEPKKYEDEYDG
ncbi:hypothetical protein LJR231_003449 [Phyllobacterium sp. LjRoot231]|uniref:DUF7940 domain-containing protein n=1 Tax=Phyllobacterium sp. LjRoot231 TaxID=3342289 RepID=UPI003ECC7E95